MFNIYLDDYEILERINLNYIDLYFYISRIITSYTIKCYMIIIIININWCERNSKLAIITICLPIYNILYYYYYVWYVICILLTYYTLIIISLLTPLLGQLSIHVFFTKNIQYYIANN